MQGLNSYNIKQLILIRHVRLRYCKILLAMYLKLITQVIENPFRL